MQAALKKVDQVNTRVDAETKQRADEVLSLMGSSAPQLVRAVLAKVACGAKDYDELMGAIEGVRTVPEDTLVQDGWSLAEDFFRSIGIEPSGIPADSRSWEEVYDDARIDHFIGKGAIQ